MQHGQSVSILQGLRRDEFLDLIRRTPEVIVAQGMAQWRQSLLTEDLKAVVHNRPLFTDAGANLNHI